MMITTWFDDDPLFNRYYPYDSAYRYYFDHEWSLPTDQDTHLFEFLSLGGFAAGLSWSGVLKKRPALTTAFSDWQIDVVAAYDEAHITKLLANPQLIRNRRKIMAVIHNAQLIHQIQQTRSFADYLWQLLNDQQLVLNAPHFRDLPRTTITGDQLARHLHQAGFQFVGPVTVNAWLVNTGFIAARPDQRGIINANTRIISPVQPLFPPRSPHQLGHFEP